MPTLTTSKISLDLGNRYQTKTFEKLLVAGTTGTTGTLEVKLNGTSVGTSDVLLGPSIDASIPKDAFVNLSFTATHTVQFLLTDAGGTGAITFTFRRIPTPLSTNDSLSTSIESFKEFVDAREQAKLQLVIETNAFGSL